MQPDSRGQSIRPPLGALSSVEPRGAELITRTGLVPAWRWNLSLATWAQSGGDRAEASQAGSADLPQPDGEVG